MAPGLAEGPRPDTVDTRERDSPFSWSPRDYLLRGQFCPADALEPALARLRATIGAEAALLLVASSRGLLRTLCCYTSKAPAGGDVTAFLRSGPKLRMTAGRRLRPRRDLDRGIAADAVLAAIAAVAKANERPEIAGELGSTADWLAVRVPAQMDGMTLTVAVLARSPDRAFVAEVGRSTEVICDEHLLDLAAMASSTANASVHRDTIVTTRVDEKLDLHRGSAPEDEVVDETQQLVELAAEVTSSAAAAYYIRDAIDGCLERAAVCVNGDSVGEFPQHLAALDPEASSLAARRHRPVTHGWAGSDPLIALTLRLGEPRRHYVEMATPVPGPLASGSTPPVGVLTVVRVSEDEREARPFGAYDHALLRNVALRLALLRANEDMESAATMFRELTIRGSRNAFSRLATGQANDLPRSMNEDALAIPVPDDIAIALPSISAALRDVATLTGSHSVTFRAALPDPSAKAPHGLSLVRVAAFPPDCIEEAQAVQDFSVPGINCRAATSGLVQNIADVAQDPAYQILREHTVSEISVPVALEGMVVGIVNLESPVERNYDGRISTVIAFAEHVGMVLANARLALANELHGYATEIVKRAHDLSAESAKISTATAACEPAVRAQVGQALADIEARARGIRAFGSTDESRQPADMSELVVDALKAAGIEHIERSSLDRGWQRFDSGAAEVVFECFRHVLTNVQNQHPVDARAAPSLDMQLAHWGGRQYDVLQVRNEAKEPPSPMRAANAYRVPIFDRAWRSPTLADSEPVRVPRFGAYLAGNQARLLGGDVHLALEAADLVRVNVMLPHTATETADA
jgi:hypothetical protein